MKKALSVSILTILLFSMIAVSLPASPLHIPKVAAQNPTPQIVQQANSRLPLTLTNNGSFVEVNHVAFYTGTAGYDEIYLQNSSILVYNEQITLQYLSGSNWKQIGTPQSVSYVQVSSSEYNVTRFYSNSLGTTYNVTYSVVSGQPVKVSINLQSGQSSTFRIHWALSGITLTNYIVQNSSLVFYQSPNNLTLGWSDVLSSFGNITTSSVTTGAQGRDSDIYFGIGALSTNQRITIDPSIVQTSSNGYTGGSFTSISATFSSVTTSGDTLVVAWGNIGKQASAISDNLSSTFTSAASICSGTQVCTQIWTAPLTGSTHDKVTVTMTATGYATITIFEVSDFSVASLQQCTTISTATNNPCTTSVNVGAADLVVAVASNSNQKACSYNSGYSTYDHCADQSTGVEWSITPSNTGTQTNFINNNAAQATYFSETVIDIPPSVVTQPVTCTMSNAASALTLTLSGGSPSPSTVLCDGSSHNIVVNPLITMTATEPANNATNRGRFIVSSAASTTVSVSTCASGTCSAWTFTNYEQESEKFSYSISGGGSGYTAPNVTSTYLGTLNKTILTTSNVSLWLDFNKYWNTTNPLTGSGSSERWIASTSTSGTSSNGSTIATIYRNQYNLTNVNSLSIVRTVNGTAQAASSPASLWFDANTNIVATGRTTVTFSSINFAAYLYQETSTGFQVLSNVTITNLAFSSPVLSWSVAAKAHTKTGFPSAYSVNSVTNPPDSVNGYVVDFNSSTPNIMGITFTVGGSGSKGSGSGSGSSGGSSSGGSSGNVTNYVSQIVPSPPVNTSQSQLITFGIISIIVVVLFAYAFSYTKKRSKPMQKVSKKLSLD